MADLGNLKIKDTYTLVLQTDSSGNLQNLDGTTPNPFIVNGNLRYVDGNQASNYVLTSDGSGNASWAEHAHTSILWSANTDGSISPSGLTTSIGIGTTTPNSTLTVVGGVSATTFLSTNVINAASIQGSEFNSTSDTGYKINTNKSLWVDDGDTQVGNTSLDTDILGTTINLQTATTVVGYISASTNVYSNNLVLKANAGGTDYGQITPDVNHGTIKFMTKPPGTVNNGETLSISQDLIEAKCSPAQGTPVSYLKLQPVDGGQSHITFNEGGHDIDFRIFSSGPAGSQVAFKLDAATNMMAFRDYVGIGYSADKWPTDSGSLAGTPTYQLRVVGQTLLSGVTTPLEVMGNISGNTDLYLGSATYTASTIAAQEQLTIKGRGVDNDYMILRQDQIDLYIDGSQYMTLQSGGINFNASSEEYDFTIQGDDGWGIFKVYGDSGENRIRVRDHLTIGPNSSVSHVDSVKWGLAVTGSSLFYSGGSESVGTTNAIQAYGNISGSTNLYVDKKVGVGTSNPNKTLTVVGDISANTVNFSLIDGGTF